MNVEVYDLDSLRKIIRELQKENRNLKNQLTSAGIAFSERNYFSDGIEESEEYDPDQGARIIRPYINKERARDFTACSGVGWMCTPSEGAGAAISRNV